MSMSERSPNLFEKVRRERIVWAGSARFPRTLRLLRSSGAEFLNARLSVLRPGTHITPHCGESSAFRSG